MTSQTSLNATSYQESQVEDTMGVKHIDQSTTLYSNSNSTFFSSSTAYVPLHRVSDSQAKNSSLHSSEKPLAPPQPHRRRWAFPWYLELGATLLSVSSLIAAIALLRNQDDRLLSAWTFPTSLNTIISILGSISRASLAFAVSACIGQQKWNWLKKRSDRLIAFERFDEASRGPFGSTKLLIWLRAR